MKRKGALTSRAIMTIVLLTLAAALLRHFQPPDSDVAFPRGAIVIGVDGSYPPFALDDGGTLQGLDIDLGEAIAAEIGLPARFVSMGFYGLYDALISGEVDLLIAALRVDQARTQDVRYTQPYFDNGLVLVTASSAIRANLRDLSNLKLAYEYASGADSQIRKWEAEGHNIMRLPYELPGYALDALRLSQADAALVDATTLRLYIKEHTAWAHQSDYVTREPYALALRLGNEDASKLVERALSALKGRGELATIVDRWL